MHNFYLVRHAHAQWTPDENRSLSNMGRISACTVADILQQYPIRAIYSSPYKRAQQTVEPLAAQLNLQVKLIAELRERQLGNIAEGDFLASVEEVWRSPTYAHPEGESNATAQKRGMAVINHLQKKHVAEDVVLSTHGNLMALILQAFDPSIDYEFWKSLTMPDIYELRFDLVAVPGIRRLWREDFADCDNCSDV